MCASKHTDWLITVRIYFLISLPVSYTMSSVRWERDTPFDVRWKASSILRSVYMSGLPR